MNGVDVENLKGAIAFANSTIRSLILVNGGAAGGLLTFYGNHPSEFKSTIVRHALHGSLVSFGTGVFLAIVSAICAYFAQRSIATKVHGVWEWIFTVPAILAVLASAAEFGNGLYLASAAL